MDKNEVAAALRRAQTAARDFMQLRANDALEVADQVRATTASLNLACAHADWLDRCARDNAILEQERANDR